MLKGVVIDPGHGGSDPGAVNGKVYEKDINLKISKLIYDKLKSRGIPVYLTRSTDQTLSPSERVKKIRNAFGTSSDVITISNHMNAGGGTGAEVIYGLRNSNKLSKLILSNLEKSGQPIRKYYQKKSATNPQNDYYFIIRDTKNNETVLIEYGFIDNQKDLDRVYNNLDKYADAVVNTILEYKGLLKDTVYVVKKGDTIFMGNNE